MLVNFQLTQFSLILLIICILIIFLIIYDNLFCENNEKNHLQLLLPPSPFKLPIIGHLHLLKGYKIPYQAFTDLGKKYGSVVQLKLGNVKCVIINEKDNIHEALVTKGHHFDSRPNFQRYQQLFSGNKENSLAFCNWSNIQKTRRDMLKIHTFPRILTNKFDLLENLILKANETILSSITDNQLTDIKPIILRNCANIFTQYFCTKEFNETDAEFNEMIDCFDEIFYEVNCGYIVDFLPFLMPLHRNNIKRLNNLTHKIRKFVLNRIIENRYNNYNNNNENNNCEDYVDSLIKYIKNQDDNNNNNDDNLTWNTALFALEDIIGGHSAIGNFLIKIFVFLSNELNVQENIFNEIKSKEIIKISDRKLMPYTEACIYEAIRLIASPIVPRVASQDSSINGYRIEKDTLIFLNNYDLSMSDKLWNEPEKFQPERFIKNNQLIKPDHFLPFGGGRRSCMGYKLVQLISFGILTSIIKNFKILPNNNNDNNENQIKIGSLALPKNTYQFKFIKR